MMLAKTKDEFVNAKRTIDRKCSRHMSTTKTVLKLKRNQYFIGTAGFSSLNSHLLKQQSRRDDLEGLAYLMIYLMKGKLPWHGIPPCRDRHQRYNQITKKKFETKPEDLITPDMPTEFFLFYQYCRGVQFEQNPDYAYLHRLLRDLIYAESFNYALTFQWLVKNQQLSTSQSSSSAQKQNILKQKNQKQ